MRTRRSAAVVLVLFAACRFTGESEPAGGPRAAGEVAVATPVGTPAGPATTREVGALGGTVVTPDGAVIVTVPAGTFASPSTLSITPITNRARGGVTQAFRIESSQPLAKAVTITLEGPHGYPVGTDLQALGVRWQDASGFWQPVDGVVRQAGSNSLVVTTSHLSDWTVVWEGGLGALSGSFTLDQQVGIPFAATGVATLYQQTKYLPQPVYVLTGTITVPPQLDLGDRLCTPDRQTQVLDLSIAEIEKAQLRFGLPARWALSCVDKATNAPSSELLATQFDTMRIALTRCPGAYVGTQVNGSAVVDGAYRSDCGGEGAVTATWSFTACPEGGRCAVDGQPCHEGRVTCDADVPACVDTALPIDDGVSCGGANVCAGGACGPP